MLTRASQRFNRVFLMFAVLSLTCTAFGQYEVKQWTNLEDPPGVLPDNLYWFGNTPSENVQVVEWSKVQGMPAPFINRETGKFGLKIFGAPDPSNARTYNQGIVAQQVVDRDSLGEDGRALYQADFFVPEGELPSIAVLAMEASEANLPAPGEKLISVRTGFYRFGLTLGSTLYFSYVAPGQEKALVYLQDKDLLAQIPKGAWHRFQIVCQGPNEIRCYVDGRETSFSPITEPTMRKLMVGVMRADQKRAYECYADNLSIQVSTEAPNLPDSPYQTGWTIPATSGSAASKAVAAPAKSATRTPPPSMPALPGTEPAVAAGSDNGLWLDPLVAWDNAKQKNVPFLLYFYAPGIPGTQAVDEFFASNKGAKDFLGKRAPTKIDVNQLEGGTLAQKYNIFKVPTLLEFTPDGQKTRRATYNKGDTWDALQSKMK